MSENLFRCGAATTIGSLPHLDPAAAAALIMAQFPDLPTMSTLPNLGIQESMLVQALAPVQGVMISEAGQVSVDLDQLDPVIVRPRGSLSDVFAAFLAEAHGHTGWIKIQVAGPVTLALALHQAGLGFSAALRVGSAATLAELRSQIGAVRAALPAAKILATLDEPSIRIMTDLVSSVERMRAMDEISRVFASLGEDVSTGLHCCAETDWSLLIDTCPDVLFAPLDTGVLDAPGALAAHLERGGWVCWGVVPTAQPIGSTSDHIWKRLATSWCDLVRAGCDPTQLRTQALISPECGLGMHGISQVDHIIEVTKQVAGRVHDQVVAVRFAVGA